MSPARWPRGRDDARLLVVDPEGGLADAGTAERLADWLGPGDLLVVNDAATLPASLSGHCDGRVVEARLAEPPRGDRAWAVLMGEGDWRTPTEHRPAPPSVKEGDHLILGPLAATVTRVSPLSARLVELRFDREGDALVGAIYRWGRPVQYAHLRDELALWSVQTAYAARPWAVELPSAGRPLSGRALAALRDQGVRIAALTHAAGLSATGDPRLDAALPLPERYDLPQETVAAITETKAVGGRIVAVGTTVVRALEDCHHRHGRLLAGEGLAELVLDGAFVPQVVDGLLTGMHDPTESHFRLLQSFASRELLEHAHQRAVQRGYLGHEFGDVALVLRGVCRSRRICAA